MFLLCNEKVEHTKGAIGRRKSKKDEQYTCNRQKERRRKEKMVNKTLHGKQKTEQHECH